MKPVLTHVQACQHINDWGNYSNTPLTIQHKYVETVEQWFKVWWANATAADIEECDRFSVGYDGVDKISKMANTNFGKYGYCDTEGGAALAHYVRLRALGVKENI